MPDDRAAKQRQANLRLALVLASIAAIFFIGFIARRAFLG